jgi:hypothetical protein
MVWFFPVMVITGVLVSLAAAKGEKGEDGSLTRRGVIKASIILVVLFIVSFGTVYFTR